MKSRTPSLLGAAALTASVRVHRPQAAPSTPDGPLAHFISLAPDDVVTPTVRALSGSGTL